VLSGYSPSAWKRNSRKFKVASYSSTWFQLPGNRRWCSPPAPKRSELVAVVAPMCIKGLRLVTMQLPEKFSPIGVGDQPKFAYSAFSEVHQRFIVDSSPVASVNALCSTAGGLRAVSSPLYATRREEDVEDQPVGGAGGSGRGPSGSVAARLVENERPRKGEAEDLTSPLTWRSVLQEVQK
jgi:hypothetical protein